MSIRHRLAGRWVTITPAAFPSLFAATVVLDVSKRTYYLVGQTLANPNFTAFLGSFTSAAKAATAFLRSVNETLKAFIITFDKVSSTWQFLRRQGRNGIFWYPDPS